MLAWFYLKICWNDFLHISEFRDSIYAKIAPQTFYWTWTISSSSTLKLEPRSAIRDQPTIQAARPFLGRGAISRPWGAGSEGRHGSLRVHAPFARRYHAWRCLPAIPDIPRQSYWRRAARSHRHPLFNTSWSHPRSVVETSMLARRGVKLERSAAAHICNVCIIYWSGVCGICNWRQSASFTAQLKHKSHERNTYFLLSIFYQYRWKSLPYMFYLFVLSHYGFCQRMNYLSSTHRF